MAKSGYVSSIDKLPLIVKILLALPILDGIIYGIYRILKGNVIWGIVWLFLGAAILWIVDIFCIIIYRKPTVLV